MGVFNRKPKIVNPENGIKLEKIRGEIVLE